MAKTSNPNATTDARLREIFKTMDPHKAQEIRDAYYKVMEGIYTLVEALEIEDSTQTPNAGPLLDEHFIALDALKAISRSCLGKVL